MPENDLVTRRREGRRKGKFMDALKEVIISKDALIELITSKEVREGLWTH